MRELRNVIEQAVLLAPQPDITAELLRLVPATPLASSAAGAPGSSARTLEDVERDMEEHLCGFAGKKRPLRASVPTVIFRFCSRIGTAIHSLTGC